MNNNKYISQSLNVREIENTQFFPLYKNKMLRFWLLPKSPDCEMFKEIHTTVADTANTDQPSGDEVLENDQPLRIGQVFTSIHSFHDSPTSV